MSIPSKLKIGGQYIRVIVTDDVPRDGNGFWDNRKATIFIYKNMPVSEQEVTLVHEIIHALNNSIEEKEVEFLAQGIYQVLVDNRLYFDRKAGK